MNWQKHPMRSLLPTMLLSAALLWVMSGCGGNEETNGADVPSGGVQDGSTGSTSSPTDPRSSASPDHTTSRARPPVLSPDQRSDKNMIESFIDLLDDGDISSELTDEDEDQIRQQAAEANEYWKAVKADNLEAIHQANRQVIHSRSHAASIILIVADDLGYGDLGCYGQEKIKTPHLDAMAAEGLRFTNYYAGSPLGVPSRTSLATGLHTGHARLRGNKPARPIKTEDCTLAELLWRAGYTTAVVGRWGLGDAGTSGTPNRQGFEYAFGYLNHEAARNYFPPMLWLNGEQVEIEGNQDGAQETYSPTLITDEALAWLEYDFERPFFLQINYTLPHADVGAVPGDSLYDNEDWPSEQKQYAAIVSQLDHEVGRILDLVNKIRYRDDIVVFFTSDNGPHADGVDPSFFQSAGPLRGRKGELTEGGIRVPMIVWANDLDQQHVARDYLWAAWDLMPTFADLAEAIRRPANLDGVSMVDTFYGHEPPEREFLYWEIHEPNFQQAIRSGKWKGIRTGLAGPLALYDLEADPGETSDVAGDNAEAVERLEALLNDARTESVDWPVRSEQ